MNQGTKNFIPQKGEQNEQQDVADSCLMRGTGKYSVDEPQNHQNSEQECEAHGGTMGQNQAVVNL